MTVCACWHVGGDGEEQEGWWEDTFFLLFWRSLPALLTCDVLCWLEAGCGTAEAASTSTVLAVPPAPSPHCHRYQNHPGSATSTILAVPLVPSLQCHGYHPHSATGTSTILAVPPHHARSAMGSRAGQGLMGLSAWPGLTDGMVGAAVGRQGWQSEEVHGRNNVLCWPPFPQLEAELCFARSRELQAHATLLLPGWGQVSGGVAKVSVHKAGVCPETCASNLAAQHHF